MCGQLSKSKQTKSAAKLFYNLLLISFRKINGIGKKRVNCQPHLNWRWIINISNIKTPKLNRALILRELVLNDLNVLTLESYPREQSVFFTDIIHLIAEPLRTVRLILKKKSKADCSTNAMTVSKHFECVLHIILTGKGGKSNLRGKR